MLTQTGATDVAGHQGRPLCVVMQKVRVAVDCIVAEAQMVDIKRYGLNAKGYHTPAAVFLAPFPEHVEWGALDEELTAEVLRKNISAAAAQRKWLQTVSLMIDTIAHGLERKYRPAKTGLLHLLAQV